MWIVPHPHTMVRTLVIFVLFLLFMLEHIIGLQSSYHGTYADQTKLSFSHNFGGSGMGDVRKSHHRRIRNPKERFSSVGGNGESTGGDGGSKNNNKDEIHRNVSLTQTKDSEQSELIWVGRWEQGFSHYNVGVLLVTGTGSSFDMEKCAPAVDMALQTVNEIFLRPHKIRLNKVQNRY